MASAWGKSWGQAFGTAFGRVTILPPKPEEIDPIWLIGTKPWKSKKDARKTRKRRDEDMLLLGLQ